MSSTILQKTLPKIPPKTVQGWPENGDHNNEKWMQKTNMQSSRLLHGKDGIVPSMQRRHVRTEVLQEKPIYHRL